MDKVDRILLYIKFISTNKATTLPGSHLQTDPYIQNVGNKYVVLGKNTNFLHL